MLVDELTVIKTSKQEEELTQSLLQQYTASSSAHNSPLSWKHDECPLQLESKFSPTNRWLAGAGRWLTGDSLPPKLTEMIVFVRLAERVRLLFSWMSNQGLSSLIKSGPLTWCFGQIKPQNLRQVTCSQSAKVPTTPYCLTLTCTHLCDLPLESICV